ncbi:MAG: molybdopterin converting factor subunit 1 [Thiogranum sp.]
MRVQVRFFAALRERVGISEQAISVPENATVAQVWMLAVEEKSLPDNVLAAKNMEYVDFATPVEEDDEIAFFPPVTGGGL